MKHHLLTAMETSGAILCAAFALGCSNDAGTEGGNAEGSGSRSNGSGSSSEGSGSNGSGSTTGGNTSVSGGATGSAPDWEPGEWLSYDASENSYRLDNGGGWQGESEDGCPTDKFTTWPEWECEPGELSGTIVRFWAKDTIDPDDPDFEFGGHETVVNLSDGTLEMGMQMLSTKPVVISKVDFLVEFPAELLEFSHIERHWASIKRDEPPSSHVDVEVVAPGRLKFTWWMENLPRVIDKGDIPVASMYFNILAAGEGEFTYPRPEGETWDHYSPPYQWHLKSEVTEPRPVWATMVDGTEGPVHWLWNSTLIVR